MTYKKLPPSTSACFQKAIAILPLLLTLFISSCNQAGSSRLPDDGALVLPETQSLVFSDTSQFDWDTIKTGGIVPTVEKFDLTAFFKKTFDTLCFSPIRSAAITSPFDIDKLPAKRFDLDSFPSKPIPFKTSVLDPRLTPIGKPVRKSGLPMAVTELGPEQGFPGTVITALYKDRDGIMWIGTMDGFFRYDGESLQTILSKTTFYIAGIIQDKKGRIWFSTLEQIGMVDMEKGTVSIAGGIRSVQAGICPFEIDAQGNVWRARIILEENGAAHIAVIDPEHNSFKLIPPSALHLQSCFSVVKDANNNMWVLSAEKGLSIINQQNKTFKPASGTPYAIQDRRACLLGQNDKGLIYVGSDNGSLQVIDYKKNTSTFYPNPVPFYNPDYFGCVLKSFNQQLWLGCSQGVRAFDFPNKKYSLLADRLGIGREIAFALEQDGAGRIWAGTIKGLCIIDPGVEKIKLPSNAAVSNIEEDTAQNLWLATNNGLLLADSQRLRTAWINTADGLPANRTNSILKQGDNFWLTTDGGLCIINPAEKNMAIIGKKQGLPTDCIYLALEDINKNSIISGEAPGFFLIDSGKNHILHTRATNTLLAEKVNDLTMNKDGLIWMPAHKNGVLAVDIARRKLFQLNNQPGLQDSALHPLLADEHGRIWIGTSKGLYVADKQNGTISHIGPRQGLPGSMVLTLMKDNGRVLAGTDQATAIITFPPKAADQPQKFDITAVKGTENLWRGFVGSWNNDKVSARGEYLWADNNLYLFRKYQPDTVLPATFITGISLANDRKYFHQPFANTGTDTVWHEGKAYMADSIPGNNGYIQNEPSLRWGNLSGPYNIPDNMTIPYHKNHIRFYFGRANNVGNPYKTKYRYQLEGLDANWDEPTTDVYTDDYRNLPPGKYTFKVSSLGAAGKWGPPASISFTILPPWYKTWWAYALYLLLGGSLLRLYILYRSRKLQKTNKLLEEKVQLRTRQLEQSIENLKATQAQLIQSEKMASLGELTAGIAHEIQNPLNFVNNFSEVSNELIDEMNVELDKGDVEEARYIAADIKQNLEKINHHGKRADSIVKGMLQHSKAGTGQKEPTDINALASEYLKLAYHGLRAKDKSFNSEISTHFSPEIGAIDMVRQDIGRVLLNILNNAFYAVHQRQKSEATLKPNVAISTAKQEKTIAITITDNGTGMPKHVADKVFQPFFTTKPTGQGTGLGLSLAYDIVTKGHGGQLKVDSQEGAGTTFTIVLPA